MYRLENDLFVCTVHISDLPSGKWFLCTVHFSDIPSWKCSVSVHAIYFWCTTWNAFCFCPQYTFLMGRLESVQFPCKVHISDISISYLLLCTNAKVFVLLVLIRCDFTMEKTVPITIETCKRTLFPYECDRYEFFVVHPHYSAVWRRQLPVLTSVEFRSDGQATWHTFWHLVNLSKLVSRNHNQIIYFTLSFDVSTIGL